MCILTSRSGELSNTDLVGCHANRSVLFLRKSMAVPFVSQNGAQYHAGFALCAADKQSICDYAPTIIHITVPDASSMSLMDYARQTNIPLMGTFHSNYVEYMDHYPGLGFLKPILATLSKHSYCFLQTLYVPTPFIVKNLSSEKYKLDRCTNLQVWGRGYDTHKFSPKHRCNNFRKKIGASPDDIVICIVSRLVPEKSPHIFANVIQRLDKYHCTSATDNNSYSTNNSRKPKNNLKYRGLVIGAGRSEHILKDLPNTYYAGWMDGHELSVAYASSDIFLFPSACETFGNVTLEAAGSGLPLVVESGCSGHLVNDGISGYSCAANDEDAFYEATLKLLLLDSKARKVFSQQSREISLQYEQHKVMKRMIQNYSDITDEFHNEYKGRHSNRDMKYSQNSDSFTGGTIAYPPGMGLVEHFFAVLFGIINALEWVYNGSVKIMNGRIGFAFNNRTEENDTAPIAVVSCKSTKGFSRSQSINAHNHTEVSVSTNLVSSSSRVALGDMKFSIWLAKFCIESYFKCACLINVIKQILRN